MLSVAEWVPYPGSPIPHLPRRHIPLVLGQLLWRMRFDLVLMLALCLAVLLPRALLNRDFIENPEVGATLGLAVSVFLAFRNSLAIQRWWEARGLWGAVVNQSRNWRDILLAILGSGSEQRRHHERLLQIQVLSVWLLNMELRNRARSSHRECTVALASQLGFAKGVSLQQVARERALSIEQLAIEGQFSDLGRDALIRSIVAFNDAVGALQKIRNTPIPPVYDVCVRLITWLFGFEVFMDCHGNGQSFLGILLFLAFLAAERMAAYIEGPFDTDPNCFALPLNQICLQISDDLLQSDHPFADCRRCHDPSRWD